MSEYVDNNGLQIPEHVLPEVPNISKRWKNRGLFNVYHNQ